MTGASLLTCLVLSVLAQAGGTATSVSAEPEVLEGQLGVFTLVVNEVAKGEVTILLVGDDVWDDVWIEPSELRRAGVLTFRGARHQHDGKQYVSLASLSPTLRFQLDEEGIELRVTVQPQLLQASVLRFGRQRPEDLEYRTDTTAFANYALRLNHELEHTVFLDTGVSAGGHLGHTTVFANARHGVVRGMSSLTFHQPGALRTLTVGDLTAQSGDLGGTALLGGFSLARAFELDPYFVRSPTVGLEGAALAPSTLDVYVNGTRVRSEPLPPGPFSVEQIPVSPGRGAATYVLRDAFGGAREVAADYYVSQNVLAPGASQFAYSVGLLRQELGAASFSYGPPAFSLHHRQGFGFGLTAGARAEGSPELVNAGASISGASLQGQLDVAVAASNAPQGAGLAALLAYGYSSKALSVSTSLRGLSPSYANLSLPAARDRSLVELSASAAMPLPARLSLSTRALMRATRDQGLHGEATVVFGYAFNKQWQLLGLLTETVARGGPSTALFVNVQHFFAAEESLSIGAQSDLAESHATLDITRQLPVGDGVAYRVSSAWGPRPRADIQAQLQGDYGRAGAELGFTGGTAGAALDVAGSLVMVEDLGIFLTRPTGRSFAVLQVPKVEGVRGYRENHEVGRTNADGLLFVPDLIPYYGNRLAIEHRDLPMNFELGELERVVAPPMLGGAVVTFAARSTNYLRGTVVVVIDGKPIIPEYGELMVVVGDDELASPIGKGGEFELEGVPAGVHQARIEHAGGVCALAFAVPASSEPVIELGELRCLP